jgi:hypothetical protein
MGVLMSVNIEVFSIKDIQHLSSLLSLFEAEGIFDIRFVRAEIEKHLHTKRSEIMRARVKGRKQDRADAKRYPAPKPCPECGITMRVYQVDGEFLQICTNGKKGEKHIGCQYSEVV